MLTVNDFCRLCYIPVMRALTPKMPRRRERRKLAVQVQATEPCLACYGTGRDFVQVNKPCLHCSGRGWIMATDGEAFAE